nr:WW domain-binding protein 11-like [Dermacentor andersoni]
MEHVMLLQPSQQQARVESDKDRGDGYRPQVRGGGCVRALRPRRLPRQVTTATPEVASGPRRPPGDFKRLPEPTRPPACPPACPTAIYRAAEEPGGPLQRLPSGPWSREPAALPTPPAEPPAKPSSTEEATPPAEPPVYQKAPGHLPGYSSVFPLTQPYLSRPTAPCCTASRTDHPAATWWPLDDPHRPCFLVLPLPGAACCLSETPALLGLTTAWNPVLLPAGCLLVLPSGLALCWGTTGWPPPSPSSIMGLASSLPLLVAP